MAKSSFQLSRLRQGLRPFRLHWFPRLRSTNDHAARLRRSGRLFAPAVVLAGRQTAGRGRGANVWHSAGGSLTLTFVIPVDDRIAPHHLPIIAGLAVRNAAAAICRSDAIKLKWPNDLLHNGRKLGGLLCERLEKADLVGLGLNVNVDSTSLPADLRDRAASLRQIAGRALDLTDVTVIVASHLRDLAARAAEQPFAAVLHEYDTHHALLGRVVSVSSSEDEPPLTGKCEGLDSMGRLVLRNRTGLHRVISGHVIMR